MTLSGYGKKECQTGWVTGRDHNFWVFDLHSSQHLPQIDSEYDFKEVLGEGSFGKVHKAPEESIYCSMGLSGRVSKEGDSLIFLFCPMIR